MDAFGYELNAGDAAMIMADQISMAAAGTDSEMHAVGAVKIEAADEPSDPMELGFPKEEDDVGEESPTKLEPNTDSEQVSDRAPISEVAPTMSGSDGRSGFWSIGRWRGSKLHCSG